MEMHYSSGYINDPAEGDVDNGVPPGTPFEELSNGATKVAVQ